MRRARPRSSTSATAFLKLAARWPSNHRNSRLRTLRNFILRLRKSSPHGFSRWLRQIFEKAAGFTSLREVPKQRKRLSSSSASIILKEGQPARYRVLSRRQSYHGSTLGAMTVSGNVARRAPYRPLFAEWGHIAPCFCYHCPFDKTFPQCQLACADDLDSTFCR